MDVPQLAAFDAELVAVWRVCEPTEIRQDRHGSVVLVNHVPAVRRGHVAARRDSQVARIVGRATPCIGTAFQPGAGRTPGNHHGLILHVVKVRIPGSLDRVARVSLLGRDRIPALLKRVMQRVRSVEQPVIGTCRDRVDLDDLGVRAAQLGANDARPLGI